MKTQKILFVAVLAVAAIQPAEARSATVAAKFQRLHPCPVTHKKTGACPGWVKDHIIPLCAGGLDSVENMQWQTLRESYKKDVQERKQCRALKAGRN